MNFDNSEIVKALKDIQSKCIGLFKTYHTNKWELVVSAEKYEDLTPGSNSHMLIAISVGELLGLWSTHVSSDAGIYVQFPDNKTLTQMMKDPIEFYKWYNDNIKK